jgi:iron uptake system component EfeO
MRLAVAGSAVLVILGAWAFAAASRKPPVSAPADAIAITIKDGRCDPNVITVPAGPSVFRILNQSDRKIEWEILDGVMVVEERENIIPGMSQIVRANLQAGNYTMTCGLLANPRGALRVTPSAQPTGAPSKPSLVAFLGPLAEFRVLLAMQSAALTNAAQALDAAVAQGNAAQAQAAYQQARQAYKQIEPAAKRFADLDSVLDPPAGAFEKREQDAGFVGFHRVEYGLFGAPGLDGLAPFTLRLATDAKALQDRLRETKFTPDQIADGAARIIRALAETRIVVGDDDYSHTDLQDFAANLAGVTRMMTLLKPVTSKAAPDVFSDIQDRIDAARGALEALRAPGGFPSYVEVDGATRAALAAKFGALADALEKFNAAVGLG